MSRIRAASQPKCGKTARVTKYGSPYTLICQREQRHSGNCRDNDNGLWFEPDPRPTA